MGKALELIGTSATAPGAGAAFTAVAGNSLQVRDHRQKAYLIDISSIRQTPGFFRLTSPLLHDSTVGIQVLAPQIINQMFPPVQELFSQDQLTAFGSGSAVAGDIEISTYTTFYEDLPGVEANLITADELRRRGEEIYSWQNQVVATGAGGYTGSQAITTLQDQLKANREYAILGAAVAVSGVPNAAIRYVGPDWGNLGVGVPLDGDDRGNNTFYFEMLSKFTSLPTVPVFNAANKALTFISMLCNENGVSVQVNTTAVLLAPKARK
ncbi:MAG: hypothetical protein ABFD89_18885 [Bryobacteraceae bacterium]